MSGERRVAATPESIRRLREHGYAVVVERGAGDGASITDEDYTKAGATVTGRDEALGCDIVAMVRPPAIDDVATLREGALLVCVLQAERCPEVVDALVARRVSVLALERVPRVTRAQKMDVLSSMANLAGYRAVIEAAEEFHGFFAPQMTAAGTTPPARVLVIGAGVAGLAAVAAARALGAEVRAFDTRAAAREQVESLGASFLQVQIEESGDGGGGYAREMSPAFIAAEMALFRAQAREVDVIITTALVPGKKAPRLVPTDVVEAMKPGSVVVDMAAEQGGNCELTQPGAVVTHGGVSVVGYTDLASRMGRTASLFFSTNVAHLLLECGDAEKFSLDLDNDVLRPALVAHAGERLEPIAPKPPTPPTPTRRPPPPNALPAQRNVNSPTRHALGTTVGGALLIAGLFALGRFAPGDFLQHFTVFILACFLGWQVVWSVTPALHTPLMSVTNAISGIIIVGGMLQIGDGLDLASALGAAAVLVAAINVAGGFLVTQRMLKMFRREAPGEGDAHGPRGAK